MATESCNHLKGKSTDYLKGKSTESGKRTESFNHLKGKNTALPPKRGKILNLILEDFFRKRDDDNSLDARKGKTGTTAGILEDLILKLKGKNQPFGAQKAKNSSLPPRRGMIKVQIFEELVQ